MTDEQARHQVPLQALERYAGRRGQQAIALIAAGQVLAPIAKRAHGYLNRREDFTITVPGTDDIYADLHEWVLERMPEDKRKALIGTTTRQRVYEAGSQHPISRVRLHYDGKREQVLMINGHRVVAKIDREEFPARVTLPENWRQMTDSLIFTASDIAGRDAVVDMINELLAARDATKGPPALLIPSRWGGEWNRRSDLPPRTLDSVHLRDGQLERLVADLDRFLLAETEYGRLSLPWHRGYLFHGAPGTGKTSVARALANHFGMATYYLPLGDLEKDAELMQLVSGIEPRSLLLIEDADTFHATTDRTDKARTGVAAMLNALDGVWTPHGLVTILTTNDRARLDGALIREGRIDVDEEFALLDEHQAARLARWLGVDRETALGYAEFAGQSPATMIQTLKGGLA